MTSWQGRVVQREAWPLKTLWTWIVQLAFILSLHFLFWERSQERFWQCDAVDIWNLDFLDPFQLSCRAACAVETGLVAMVDNVLTTDMGQVSVLDPPICLFPSLSHLFFFFFKGGWLIKLPAISIRIWRGSFVRGYWRWAHLRKSPLEVTPGYTNGRDHHGNRISTKVAQGSVLLWWNVSLNIEIDQTPSHWDPLVPSI